MSEKMSAEELDRALNDWECACDPDGSYSGAVIPQGACSFCKLRAHIATLQREADGMREALTKAAETFRVYARLHRAKETAEGEEKAKANERHAEMCEAAQNLSPQEPSS